MTCAEFKERVGAYALGILEGDERAACDAHVAAHLAHEGCLEALAVARETTSLLPLALTPVAPSPSTWREIERRIGGAVSPMAAAAPRRRRGWPLALGWAVAAAAALLLWLAVRDRATLQAERDGERQKTALTNAQQTQCAGELERLRAEAKLQREAMALLQKPGARLVALAPQGGARFSANMIMHPGQARAIVLGSGLVAQPGHDYELWLIRGERKIAAGLLHGDAAGAVVAAVDPALLQEGAPDAVAVTLEPAGGGPAPRGPAVLVGKL